MMGETFGRADASINNQHDVARKMDGVAATTPRAQATPNQAPEVSQNSLYSGSNGNFESSEALRCKVDAARSRLIGAGLLNPKASAIPAVCATHDISLSLNIPSMQGGNGGTQNPESWTAIARRRSPRNISGRSYVEIPDCIEGMVQETPSTNAPTSQSPRARGSRSKSPGQTAMGQGQQANSVDVGQGVIQTSEENPNVGSTIPCVVIGCTRKFVGLTNMRQHFNEQHALKMEKRIDSTLMKRTNSTICPKCRSLFKIKSNGEPWHHNNCSDAQPTMQEDQPTGSEESKDTSRIEVAQTHNEWIKTTTATLTELAAAERRGDKLEVQSLMYKFVTGGSRVPIVEGTEMISNPGSMNDEELIELLELARSVAAEKAASATPETDAQDNIERLMRIVRHISNGEISSARQAICQKGGLREATIANIAQLQRKYFPQVRAEAQTRNATPPLFPLRRYTRSRLRRY